jgi:putative transcriptional regulator
MPNHPNRSAGRTERNPSPCEIRAAREAAGLTQAQAAGLVYASLRNWQQWEQAEGSNVRRMHPGLWELFQSKAKTSAPHHPAYGYSASPIGATG